MSLAQIKWGLAGAFLLLYVLSGIYVVGSDEMGVVIMYGRVIENRVPPGIHYRLPWPITALKTPQVAAIRRMSIGFELLKQMQDIPASQEESERLTGDMNVVNVALIVQYTVHDPTRYLFAAEAPDFLIRKAGEAFLCQRVGAIRVDDLLTVSKSDVELSVRLKLQAFLDSMGTGLLVSSCNLQRIEPPSEVIEAFNDVARAKANREKTISEAQSYSSELLPRARGEAQKMVQTAQALSAARMGRAQGDVARFDKLLAEYKVSPSILRHRLFWDTVQEILKKARKVIVEDKKGQRTNLRIVQPAP